MRVIVCGDRHWYKIEVILSRLTKLPWPGTTVVHGGCKGADKIAGKIAWSLGFDVQVFPARWSLFPKYGAAGPIRNGIMLREGKPDLVLAFHNDLDRSKGTAGMIALARKAGVPVEILTDTSDSQ